MVMKEKSRADSRDRVQRIAGKERELLKMADGHGHIHISENCPSQVAEAFLDQVLAFERGIETSYLQEFKKAGIDLPSAEELDDESLKKQLWLIIDELARRGAYLEHTDHLSDRQLYVHLLEDTLKQGFVDCSEGTEFGGQGNWHIDLLGGWSEEDTQTWLRFYADEDDRENWQLEWKEDIPPREQAPFDRDRHLPSPKFPI